MSGPLTIKVGKAITGWIQSVNVEDFFKVVDEFD